MTHEDLFNPQTPGEAALAAVTRAGDQAEELIRVWREAGNAAALLEVAEAGTGSPRKAARRAVNVLKARGINVERRPRTAQITSSGEELLEAWLATPDSSLNLVLAVARWPKARRGKVVFAFLNDGLGLLNLRVAEIAQSGFKAEVKRLLGDRVRPVKVPVDWARARIAAVRAKNAERKLPLPLGLASAADLLEPLPEVAPGHPFDEEGLDLADEDASILAEGSAQLHRLPEFGAWLPAREAVSEMLLDVGKDLAPGQKPSEQELGERVQAAIRSATDRYFSPEHRERLVVAMKDGALAVLAREGEVKALEVAAAIKAVERCGLITDPPHQVPFLRAFFEKAVQVLLAQNQGQLRIPVAGGQRGEDPSGETLGVSLSASAEGSESGSAEEPG